MTGLFLSIALGRRLRCAAEALFPGFAAQEGAYRCADHRNRAIAPESKNAPRQSERFRLHSSEGPMVWEASYGRATVITSKPWADSAPTPTT